MAWSDQARQASVIARMGRGMPQQKARARAGAHDYGNAVAANMLAAGHPKSKAVPVNPGMLANAIRNARFVFSHTDS